MTDDELLYVYAVTPPFSGVLPDGVRGLDGEPPRIIEHDGLCAAVSRVPAAEFDAEPLRSHLEDLDWLAETARAHQAVIAALASVTCPVPLRLATVCRDDSGVRRLIDSGRARFVPTIERLDGRVEWGVKVYAHAQLPPPEPESKVSSGRDYLRRRLGQRQSRDDTWRRAGTLSRALHTELCGRAEAGRLHRPQSGQLSGAPGENVLNAAYLVPREQSEQFVAAVRAHTPDDDGVRVELTGPWAPYSFAGGPDEGQGEL
ncbi:GvpL/GvpF family gas vesicle protein [Streptomyces sp. NBC_00083]|uniref:GvpL/GvpF family gas vesicle protein n=1 Tax=Streptomyces sp. NBC_00083 TaxID=2975647 RepID=UPI00225B9A23|nr:GvpL/GvpF family gas vesicle protein [Streptomyces sp. NBC_00083]MCX5386583.1 GvpL/GvpF family gas vesicle protein [Streptomyces sp. NBC_00083]